MPEVGSPHGIAPVGALGLDGRGEREQGGEAIDREGSTHGGGHQGFATRSGWIDRLTAAVDALRGASLLVYTATGIVVFAIIAGC